MEFQKSHFMRLLVAVMALTLGVGALKCYDGSQDWGTTEVTCDPANKYCVLWADYSFNDYYAFCDDSNLCTNVGFTNYTYYGVTCCQKDDCNPVPVKQTTFSPISVGPSDNPGTQPTWGAESSRQPWGPGTTNQ